MRKRIATIFAAGVTAILLGFGTVAPATAAPVESVTATSQHSAALPMGNGTNDFYLSGKCSVPYSWVGFTMKVTNWDYGSNQKYHVSWSRSGVAYILDGIYYDGVYQGKSSDFIVTKTGHYRHTWTLKGHLYGDSKNSLQCSVTL